MNCINQKKYLLLCNSIFFVKENLCFPRQFLVKKIMIITNDKIKNEINERMKKIECNTVWYYTKE